MISNGKRTAAICTDGLVRGAALGLTLWLAEGHPVHAVTLFQKSAYTALDLTHCTALSTAMDGTAYVCPGLPGVPVYFAEGDGRTFLSAGAALGNSRAAHQTLQSVNTVFPSRTGRATIEWRFVIRDNRKVPYAMIVRYFTKADNANGQVLVVSRVSEKDTCHVAYIDARANDDAIVMARRIADEYARGFDCSHSPSAEGETGKSPM